MMSIRKSLRVKFVLTAVLLAAESTAHAQNPTGQSNMVFNMYAQAATQWMQVAHGYAQTLFGLLAVVDFAWTAVMLALEGHELNTYMARIIRKLMTISFFAVILAQGTYWMGAISASFIKVGQTASGTTAVTPAQILGDGFTMAGALLTWATTSATTIGLTTFAPAVPVLFALIVALFLLAGYAIVAINFVVTTIEGFVVIGAGYIFLGFGGSQWTRPYVERYIALAVSLGARLMILYMIVGLGHSFATQWVTILRGMSTLKVVSDPTDAFMTMCGILCGAVTYTGVAVMAPRLVGSIMSGSLSFSGNEALSMGSGAALGAAAVLAAVPSGGASLAAAGGAGTLAAGGAGASAAGLAAGSSAAASTTAMGLGTAVAPPAAAAAGGGDGGAAAAAGKAGGAGASTVSGGGLNVSPPSVGQASGTSTAGAGSVAPPPVASASKGTSSSNGGSTSGSASPAPVAPPTTSSNGATAPKSTSSAPTSVASSGGSPNGVGSLGAPSASTGSAPSTGNNTTPGASTPVATPAAASSGSSAPVPSASSAEGSGSPQTGGTSGGSAATPTAASSGSSAPAPSSGPGSGSSQTGGTPSGSTASGSGNPPPPVAAGATPPPAQVGATPAATTTPAPATPNSNLGAAAQQAKGGVERIIGATEIGSSEAPPPHAHIEGGE